MSVAIHDLDRESIQRLSQRSNSRGLVQLAAHGGRVVASGTLICASTPGYLALHRLLLRLLR